MNYRHDKYGNKISQLGFGCMRFPKNGKTIDFEETEKEILHAIDCGINYFDTAYIYPNSEETIGKIFNKNNVREKIYIADKLPQYMMRSASQLDKTLDEMLKRLDTTYIDYFLLHMFTDIAEWENLLKLNIVEWLEKQKKLGRIRQIGFSYHGDSDMFCKLLEVYDWDFCQIQYNYFDENSQAGRKGLEKAYQKSIPVIIMEPLRGGKLAKLPPDAMRLLENKMSPAELSFKWLLNQEGVTCILSGMNSMEMIDENVNTASKYKSGCCDNEDEQLVVKVRNIIKQNELVGCTGCRYCMPCPKGVDISSTFFFYNLMPLDTKHHVRFEYARAVAMRKDPGFASKCVGCGKCEKHCPQKLPIIQKLKEADKALRPLPYKIGIEAARKFLVH